MKTLASFKCLLQFMGSNGKWEHRELTVHAFNEKGAYAQMDHAARQLPCGEVVTRNLRELEMLPKRISG